MLFSDVDECRRPGACGIGAVCTNTPGSHTCSCPPKTLPDPDPYTQCLEIMKCNNNNDCPGNALCLLGQCMCPEPNIGDDCRRKYFLFFYIFVCLIISLIIFFVLQLIKFTYFLFLLF